MTKSMVTKCKRLLDMSVANYSKQIEVRVYAESLRVFSKLANGELSLNFKNPELVSMFAPLYGVRVVFASDSEDNVYMHLY